MGKRLIQVSVLFKRVEQPAPTTIEVTTSRVQYDLADLKGKRRWTDLQFARAALDYYAEEKKLEDLQVKDLTIERIYQKTTITREVKRSFL